MSLSHRHTAGLLALVVAGAAASFLLTTVLMGELPDTALLALGVMGAALLAVVVGGRPSVDTVESTDRRTLAAAAGGGALSFWLAPALALSQRATDAPSGSEVLFFVTTAWGAITILVCYAVPAQRRGLTAAVGALASAVGAAGLLGNWERPSSFAPFVKFPDEELLMLAAGVLFAVGVLLLAHAGRKLKPRELTALALAPAALGALAVGVPALVSSASSLSRLSIALLVLSAAQAALAGGWIRLSAAHGASRSATALLIVPAAVTLLSVVERFVGVAGPNPIMWSGALAGAALCLAGAATAWLSARGDARHRSSTTLRVALALASASCAVGVVALFTPAFSAVAEGKLHTGEAFRAAWTMVGAESGAGWAALAAGFLALFAVVSAKRGEPSAAWRSAAVTAIIAGAATYALVGTSFATWNRWIPADVQQAYGTEYASLVMQGVIDPVRAAAVVLAVAAAVAVLTVKPDPSAAGTPAGTEVQG